MLQGCDTRRLEVGGCEFTSGAAEQGVWTETFAQL